MTKKIKFNEFKKIKLLFNPKFEGKEMSFKYSFEAIAIEEIIKVLDRRYIKQSKR